MPTFGSGNFEVKKGHKTTGFFGALEDAHDFTVHITRLAVTAPTDWDAFFELILLGAELPFMTGVTLLVPGSGLPKRRLTD